MAPAIVVVVLLVVVIPYIWAVVDRNRLVAELKRLELPVPYYPSLIALGGVWRYLFATRPALKRPLNEYHAQELRATVEAARRRQGKSQ
jgi:hypothetical protein